MKIHANKTQENNCRSTSEAGSQVLSGRESSFQFVDNRPESIAQKKLQDIGNNSFRVKQTTKLQTKADNYTTGRLQSIQNKIHNIGLETGADVMKSKALQFDSQLTKSSINNYITDSNTVQCKVEKFKSTYTFVESPIGAYLNKADKRVFLPHQTTNESFDVRLEKLMPKTDNNRYNCQITSVEAEVSPNGSSEWSRRGNASQMVGHAGVQEALLTTGSEAFYQGGHLISHDLLGKGSDNGTAYSIDDYENLVPMEGALNNISYKKLESELDKKGPGKVKIDVLTKSPAKVPNGIVSALTECPLAPGMHPGASLEIPSTIARNVEITHSGTFMGRASEIPRMAPVNEYLTTGAQLFNHLKDIGSMPFLDPALAAKLALL